MNPAITAAIVAAQHQSPTLTDRLTKAGALNSVAAISVTIDTERERAELDKALRLGLVKRRADGHLFLDSRAVDERNAQLGRRLLLWIGIAACFLSSIAVLMVR
jgi:hypothetical protein